MSNSMPFPTDYRAAMQDLRTAFPDKLLKEMKAQNPTAEFAKFVDMLPHSEIAKDDFGLPHGSSGAAAIVYKATLPNGETRAFRVFTLYSPEVAERCDVISRYLDELMRQTKFPFLMRFTYFPRGIKVVTEGNAKKVPMLTMDWVEGHQLEKWVDLKCKKNDKAALSRACERWIELTNAMSSAGIAHGDLQHGNIMVTDQGEFRLVDYDSMCVPKLVGKANLEVGRPPYQHPKRDGKTLLTPELDRFSALFIYAALRALAASPDLWLKFPQKDTLLFTADDFSKQARSPLYQALMRSPDPEVPELTKQLFRAFGEDISKVPAIGDGIFSYDEMRELLDNRNFDEAIERLERKGNTSDAPPDLIEPIKQARLRVHARQQLENTIRSGKDSAVEQQFNRDRALLDRYPAAAGLVAEAELRVAKNNKKWQDFVRVWDKNIKLLADRSSAQGLQREVEHWRPRNAACEAVLRVLGKKPCDAQELERVWAELVQLKGHPDIDHRRDEIKKIIQREATWQGFKAVLDNWLNGPASDVLDGQLVDAWNEDAFENWMQAQSQKQHVLTAMRRLELFSQLSVAIAAAVPPLSAKTELDIVNAASKLSDYQQHAHSRRIDEARERLDARSRLLDAIKLAPTKVDDEREIRQHWETLGRLEAQSLVNKDNRHRAELAVDRLEAWKEFEPLQKKAIRPTLDVDRGLVECWDENAFKDWKVAKSARPLVRQAELRLETYQNVQRLVNQTKQPTLQGESDIIQDGKGLPPGYDLVLSKRLELAKRRQHAVVSLTKCVANASSEEKIVEAWNRVVDVEMQSAVSPDDQARCDLARRRVAGWSEFQPLVAQDASQAVDEGLVKVWQDYRSEFQGWLQTKAYLPKVNSAKDRLAILDELQNEIQRSGSPLSEAGEDRIRKVVEGRLPNGYAYQLSGRVQEACERLRAIEQLRDACAAADRDETPDNEESVLNACDRLAGLNGESLALGKCQDRASLARERHGSWKKVRPILQRMVQGSSEELDRHLVEAWDAEHLQNWKPATVEIKQLEASNARLKILQEISERTQAQRRQPSLLAEREILELASKLPISYEHSQQGDVQASRRRVGAVEDLCKVIGGASVDKDIDEQILQAGRRADEVDGTRLLELPHRNRVKLAENRLTAWPKLTSSMQQAEAAQNESSDRNAINCWVSKYFDDWARTRPLVAKIDETRKRLECFDRLVDLISQQDSRTNPPKLDCERAIADAGRELPSNYHQQCERAEQAARRVASVENLLRTITDEAPEETVADAWRDVENAGGAVFVKGEPLSYVERAKARLAAWSKLESALKRAAAKPSETCDRELVKLWRGPLFDKWERALAVRPALDAAKRRIEFLTQLERFLKQQGENRQSQTWELENEIAKVGRALPGDYVYSRRPRVEQAERRIEAVRALYTSIDNLEPEESTVLAWKRVSKEQAESLVKVSYRTSADIAQRRIQALAEFEPAYQRALQANSEQIERELIRLWDAHEELLSAWDRAQAWRPRVTQARDQCEILDELAGLAREQDSSDVTFDREIELSQRAEELRTPFQYSLQSRVEQARRRIAAIRKLCATIDQSGSEEDIVTAWSDVDSAQGTGLVEPVTRSRVDLAQKRIAAWKRLEPAFRNAVQEPNDQHDVRLSETWEEVGSWRKDLFEGWSQVKAIHRQVQDGRRRLEILTNIGRLLDGSHERTMDVLKQALREAEGLGTRSYRHYLQSPLDKIRDQVEAVEHLRLVMESPSPEFERAL